MKLFRIEKVLSECYVDLLWKIVTNSIQIFLHFIRDYLRFGRFVENVQNNSQSGRKKIDG